MDSPKFSRNMPFANLYLYIMSHPQTEHTAPVITTHLLSPLGSLVISAGPNELHAVSFSGANGTSMDDHTLIAECCRQLEEYFSGKRKVFDLPLDPAGTDFQRKVWAELSKIPYGKTISYLELARRLGDEKVIRAAAAANGANPLAILIPCHRVVGSHGELTGYAGGLHRKKWLLEFEKGGVQADLFAG